MVDVALQEGVVTALNCLPSVTLPPPAFFFIAALFLFIRGHANK